MTDAGNSRELVLDILMEILEKGGPSHVVLRQALGKYQFLSKQDRAFITRVTEGTLEYLIQIDYILNSCSKTPVSKMKPVIRNILRMSVYQILYMDRIPDSAACNEAVKLAGKRHFQGLKGFVNGILRRISREKEGITESLPDLSVRLSVPKWLTAMWRDELGEERTETVLKAFLRERPVMVRCNESLAERETILASLE
ncbi:MAG TPA: 16S rRNA (cytosine(967)-C(5))-methyltransferase, partial [Candidatus Caccovicinus merdipullorum]|nr:16S rRNA (cytosine(967)-C(5))-methyltransferase [Candidatus Caccovicinus merdipullorum]